MKEWNTMKNDKKIRIFKEKTLSDDILADLSVQLSSLLKAGIPLVTAFEIIIRNDSSGKPYLKIYKQIADKICEGSSFSDALRASDVKFPDTMVHMVSASEHTGNLSGAMAKLGDYFNKQHSIKRKISSSVAYPKLILVVLAVVLIILTVVIIPQFAEIFSDYENIPFTTELLFAISAFVKNNLFLIIIVLIFICIIAKILIRTKKVRCIIDKIKVKLPYIGTLSRTIYTSRFADTFSSLHSCGVVVTTAVETSSRTIGNIYIESQFEKIIGKIAFGVSVSEAIYLVDGFDGKLADMIRIGEESGELEGMLNIISEKLNGDAQSAITKMLSLIEPIIIITLSLIILFVMVSLMVPMLDSYALLESSISI